MSGNELPMTQEWRGPGQISCGDTQRAVVGSGLVFGRDGTGVQGRQSGGEDMVVPRTLGQRVRPHAAPDGCPPATIYDTPHHIRGRDSYSRGCPLPDQQGIIKH